MTVSRSHTAAVPAGRSRPAAAAWTSRLTAWALLVMLTLAAGYLAATFDRGLDINDEGYYLLSAAHPEDVGLWPNVAHVYAAALYRAAGGNIAAFRLAGLALILLSAGVLAHGAWRAARAARLAGAGYGAWSALIALGSLVYYAYFLRSPSYNLLAAAALNGAAGLFLLALSARRPEPWALGAGALCGVLLFVKFPSALAALALFAVLLPGGRRPAWRPLLCLGLGVAASVGVHFALVQPFDAFWRTFGGGLTYLQLLGSGHGPATLLRHVRQGVSLVRQAIGLAWPALALLVPARPLARLSGRPGAVATLTLVAFALLAWRGVEGGFQLGGYPAGVRFPVYCVAWLLLVVLALAAAGGRRPPRLFLAAALAALALPYAGAVGTANPFVMNLMFHLGPGFALAALLLAALSRRLRDRRVWPAGALALGSFACSQIVTGGLVSPYLLATGTERQTVSVSVGAPPVELRLDAESAAAVSRLRALARACGFRAGDDVLAFSDMPGLVYLLGGRAPQLPWISGVYPGAAAAEGFVLSRTEPERVRRAFVLHADSPFPAMAGLSRYGPEFPRGYVACGEFRWPGRPAPIGLWRPRDRELTGAAPP